MTKVVVDSSVHVSFYGHDANSSKTRQFFDDHTNKLYFVTPTLVAAETITILAKVSGLDLLLVSQVLASTEVVPLDSQFLTYLELYLTKSPSLKLKTSDLIITLTAKLHHATLVTWDKQLLSQNICPVKTPENFK